MYVDISKETILCRLFNDCHVGVGGRGVEKKVTGIKGYRGVLSNDLYNMKMTMTTGN